MHMKLITGLVFAATLAGLCLAQENGQPPMDPPEVFAPAESEEKPPEGDVVVFKKGTELRGVKVIRHSAMFVEIEYLPGEPALKIPTTQVAEVIYAERRDRAGLADDGGVMLGPDIMLGEEVSPEFSNRLTAPLSDTEIVFENEDIVAVVQRLAADADIQVSLDENFLALPEEARVFSHTIPAGSTFLDFLRKDLLEIVPDARVIMHYDRITVQRQMTEPAPPEAPGDVPPEEAPAEEAPPAPEPTEE